MDTNVLSLLCICFDCSVRETNDQMKRTIIENTFAKHIASLITSRKQYYNDIYHTASTMYHACTQYQAMNNYVLKWEKHQWKSCLRTHTVWVKVFRLVERRFISERLHNGIQSVSYKYMWLCSVSIRNKPYITIVIFVINIQLNTGSEILSFSDFKCLHVWSSFPWNCTFLDFHRWQVYSSEYNSQNDST